MQYRVRPLSCDHFPSKGGESNTAGAFVGFLHGLQLGLAFDMCLSSRLDLCICRMVGERLSQQCKSRPVISLTLHPLYFHALGLTIVHPSVQVVMVVAFGFFVSTFDTLSLDCHVCSDCDPTGWYAGR